MTKTMRRFTKTHNDITWLFPAMEKKSEETSENWFDTYEHLGLSLLESAYPNQESFTKDDMMDAFMKGCSEGQQFTTSTCVGLITLKEKINSMKDIDSRLLEAQTKFGIDTLEYARALIDELGEKSSAEMYREALKSVTHRLATIFGD